MLWKIAEVCGLVVLILALVTTGVLIVAACVGVICDFVKVIKDGAEVDNGKT